MLSSARDDCIAQARTKIAERNEWPSAGRAPRIVGEWQVGVSAYRVLKQITAHGLLRRRAQDAVREVWDNPRSQSMRQYSVRLKSPQSSCALYDGMLVEGRGPRCGFTCKLLLISKLPGLAKAGRRAQIAFVRIELRRTFDKVKKLHPPSARLAWGGAPGPFVYVRTHSSLLDGLQTGSGAIH